ncbi:Ig-like domain-containing protein [Dyadobacter crusticola]|uniref:Ig-like domain-containing protein n=1 Tax=Dyadobacter crusticola TaxID=292407 RepID=UPI000689CFC6|nr:T9SS type A sorting domain-containing protein [Dyadobacter crusticola]
MKKPFTLQSALITFLATFFYAATAFGQTTITTGVLSPTTVCAGGEVSVPFTITGTALPLTSYVAQLSDETGSFGANPETIGTATASPITATIKANAKPGTAYKIRVVSFLALVQVTEGTESAALRINAIPAAPTVTSPVKVEQGKAATLTATGSGLKWYAAATGGQELASKPVPNTDNPGSISYFVSQTEGGCESERAEIVVTVEACTPPAKPTVANVSYTVGATAQQLSATPTDGLLWYTADTGGVGSATAPTPSTTAAGTQDFYVSRTVSGCESERAKITVTVSACATPAPTVSNVNYTVGQTPAVLSATGTALKWYTAATGGSGSATAPTPTTTSPGQQSFYVSQTVGGCEGPRAEIIVTVSCATPKPGVQNLSYTVGQNAPALTATGDNLKWYSNASGGTGSATQPKPSTASAGTTSYFVTQTLNNCESDRAEIVVTVTACNPPAAPQVSDVAYCIGTTTVRLTAVGSGLKWYTEASGGTASTTAPLPSSATAGITSYYVTQTVGVCESARAEIKVTINQTPAPVVEAFEYCLNTTVPALTATGTALKWYAAANGGNGSASAPTPTTNAIGTKSYYVTQTLNGCESPRAEIKVTIKNASSLPSVTATLNICQNATATALTATGTALKWYTVATGGNALSGAPVPATATAGTTSYYVSQTASGLCEGPRAKIDVVVKETPAAPAVTTPLNYCVGTTAVALTPSGAAYKWYANATVGTGTITAPVPSTTTVGTISYYVTQSNTYGTLTCESPKAKLDVVVNPTPATIPTLSEAICQERTDKNYSFATSPAQGNTLNWYTAQNGGTGSATKPSVNLKTAGTTTYYVTQKTALGCESRTRAVQTIRVKPLPAVPTVTTPTIEYCQFIKADPLKATPMANATLSWFGTNATGGDPSTVAPVPSTAEGGTTSYYVGQTLEGCLGDRAKIDVKVNTTPKPTTKTYLEYCQGATAQILDATGTVLKWYRTVDGEWQGFPFTPFTDKVQDYSFYVTQTGLENKCESPKEEIKIHIKSKPSATISGNANIDLGATATINIRFTGDGPWDYILSEGTKGTANEANHQVAVKPSTTTVYLLTEVSNECGKGTPIGQAVVTVKIPTINTGNSSLREACAGKSFDVPFQQSGDFPAENSFKVQISTENEDSKFYTIPSVATNNSVTATFPDTTKGGNYYLRVISSGANPAFMVKGSVSAITIMASPLPVATLSGAQTILAGESATLKVETTGKAPWTFTLSNGAKDTLITANVTPFTFKIAPPATVIYNITKVTNSCGTGTGAGSARVQVDPILGVEPQQRSNWVKVYPTLIQSAVTVEVSGNIKPKQARVEVIDLNGRSRAIQPIEQKTTEVNFANYPSGLYLLRIQNGNLSTVQRVMKP